MKLWALLEQSLQMNGSLTALAASDGTSVSYAQLEERVRQGSARLRAFTPAGSKVAVLDEHPFDEAIHVLTLLSLDTTIIPLAYKYGEQRCMQIIEHTKPDFLYSGSASLISEGVLELCKSIGTTIITDQMISLNCEKFKQQLEQKILNDDLPPSFIMYTSGSTGRPKGAMLTHDNILANIKDIQSYFEVTATDRILINRSLSHASVMTGEFLYGLLSGACLTFYNEAFVPRRLLSLMETNGITIFCSTPTVFYQLALDRSSYSLPALRKVCLMGEYLHKQVALKISERFPHVEFYMNYGQTEASPRITYLPAQYFTVKEGCIGRPLSSMEVRVINEQGQPLGFGESGELLVKGPNIFRGYWDQPELTAVKLRNGWLHTGDVVYQDEEGYLYISGRKDDMMNRAGMNIYPKEIEDVLLGDERIREVVVFGVADPKYGQKLHISVVPYVEDTLTQTDVLNICRSKLATYQYPDVVQIVKELPRNSAGKIMRRQIV